MLKTPVLTDRQIGDFRRDGYVVVRGTFDAADMGRIDTWTRELAALPEKAGRHWVYYENSLLEPDRKIVNRIENISPFHPGFAELSQALKAPVGQLLGEDAVLFKEKVNFKMPGGDGFKPHQDSQAGWDAYAKLFVTVLICIDEATEENGCLRGRRRGTPAGPVPRLGAADRRRHGGYGFHVLPDQAGRCGPFRFLYAARVGAQHERHRPAPVLRHL